MSLAEKLVSLRKQKGLTQMDLAESLEVSRQAISRWEVGTSVPGTDNLKTLSEIYGVSLDYLLRDDAEAFSGTSENKHQERKEQEKRKNHSGALIWLVGIVVAIVIGMTILVTAIQGTVFGKGTLIGEMNNQDEDYSNQGTFIIE